MNEEQKARWVNIESERRPIFRVTVLDEDGDVESETLHSDYIEASGLIHDYHDAPGTAIIFEVVA